MGAKEPNGSHNHSICPYPTCCLSAENVYVLPLECKLYWCKILWVCSCLSHLEQTLAPSGDIMPILYDCSFLNEIKLWFCNLKGICTLRIKRNPQILLSLKTLPNDLSSWEVSWPLLPLKKNLYLFKRKQEVTVSRKVVREATTQTAQDKECKILHQWQSHVGQILEAIPLAAHHFPLNHLIGFADGYCLKSVMFSGEKGRKGSANPAMRCENEEHKTLVSNAVTDIQVIRHFHKTTR